MPGTKNLQWTLIQSSITTSQWRFVSEKDCFLEQKETNVSQNYQFLWKILFLKIDHLFFEIQTSIITFTMGCFFSEKDWSNVFFIVKKQMSARISNSREKFDYFYRWNIIFENWSNVFWVPNFHHHFTVAIFFWKRLIKCFLFEIRKIEILARFQSEFHFLKIDQMFLRFLLLFFQQKMH